MASDFKVTFWGTQGSISVSNASKTRYGSNTPCVSVECADSVFVFDMGTGFIPFGAYFLSKYKLPKEVRLFVSHYHLDHIEGFPFAGMTYTPGVSVRFYGQRAEGKEGKEILSDIFAPPYFPTPLFKNDKPGRFSFETVSHGQKLKFENGITVEVYSVPHPGGSLSFKISYGGRSFCYLSDFEYEGTLSPKFKKYLKGSDVTAIDAYFSNSNFIAGWGHTTWEQAVEVWREADIGKLVMYHHHIASTDSDLDALGKTLSAISDRLIIARDGMEMYL